MALNPAQKTVALQGVSLSILLTIAHGANDAFSNILPALLPFLQEKFTLGEAALATFVAVISVSSNVLQPFMGALSDRLGRRRVAALGLIVGSVLMSFIPVVPSVVMLYILLAIGGLGSAAFHPSATSMARAAGKHKGFSIGLFIAGGPLGSALAPATVLFVIARFGVEAVPWLSLLGVVIGMGLFTLTPMQAPVGKGSRPKLFDIGLFLGPVGWLCASGIMRSLAFVTFYNAIPLWLVNVKGFASDDPLIGWTLGLYSAASGIGVVSAGALETVLGRRLIIAGSMLLAVPLLYSIFFVPTGTLFYFVVVACAAFLTNASIPLLTVTAQDLAPHAVATASGMLMGLTWGVAGVLYIGIGALQEVIGIAAAMSLSYLFLIPAAFVALYVFQKNKNLTSYSASQKE